MAKTKYEVLVGINYPPDDTRAEIGDVLEDLDPKLAKRLLNYGVIREVGDEAPAEGTLTSQTSTEPEPTLTPDDATDGSQPDLVPVKGGPTLTPTDETEAN
jgi:hypothetical protein